MCGVSFFASSLVVWGGAIFYIGAMSGAEGGTMNLRLECRDVRRGDTVYRRKHTVRRIYETISKHSAFPVRFLYRSTILIIERAGKAMPEQEAAG